MMKKLLYLLGLLIVLVPFATAQSLDTTQWPPNTDFQDEIHYWSADGFLTEALPSNASSLVVDSLTILSGGDQVTEDVTVGGLAAKKSASPYFNVADELFFVWPDYPVIDVLVQYFANSESPRNIGFLLGQLGNTHGAGGFPFEGVTDQYQWRLFRVDNSGGWAGDQVDPSVAGSQFAGVNGGTIRLEQTSGLIIRAIAFGPEGIFGEPEEINSTGSVEFNPDDYANVAEWDINKGVTSGLDVLREAGGDQEIIESDGIGPAGDKRKAIRPAFDDGTGGAKDIYVNWQILDEWFGPTSQPSTKVKVVAEYYDDPALAGTVFGPEVYVTVGDALAFFPEAKRTTLAGSGKWMEAVWYVSDVKFKGVNVPTQAAARFTFTGPVYVSRLRLGVIRTSGVYENIDPIPDAYPFDPDPYGNYAELDINSGLKDGLDMGNNGGDQQWIQTDNIGPAGDKRTAVRPALDQGAAPFDRFMNFAILDERFGPNAQPNAKIKVAVDFFDDEALAGEAFGPEVYQSDVLGTVQFRFFPADQRFTLEGTNTWRTVAWIIDDMNFTGVNVSPQGAARFWFSDACAVYISRVRYAVIRPVGVNAGVDRLADITAINEPVSVDDWELH
ncbi:MAG: hypothetical protein GC154_08475 [bacterium]|nr:hypothetical protein [bacterium]